MWVFKHISLWELCTYHCENYANGIHWTVGILFFVSLDTSCLWDVGYWILDFRHITYMILRLMAFETLDTWHLRHLAHGILERRHMAFVKLETFFFRLSTFTMWHLRLLSPWCLWCEILGIWHLWDFSYMIFVMWDFGHMAFEILSTWHL